jgi:hypothetical protein
MAERSIRRRHGVRAARGELARPLRDTLYFAGEACDPGEEGGTVAGAPVACAGPRPTACGARTALKQR